MKILKLFGKSSCLFFLIVLLNLPVNVIASEVSDILFISSYDKDSKYFRDNLAGINSAYNNNININVKYLSDYNEHNITSLFNDISLGKSEVVVLGGDDALKLLINNKDRVDFPKEKKIVFVGVVENSIVKEALDLGITGVMQRDVMEDAIQLIEKIHPTSKSIIVIKEEPLDTEEQKHLEQLKEKHNELKIDAIVTDNKNIEQLADEIKNNSKNEVIISLISPNVELDEYNSRDEVIDYLDSITESPIYDLYSDNISGGMVGAKIVDKYKQGMKIAEIVSGLDKGISPEKLLVNDQFYNNYIFDYQKLKELGISIDSLPLNSIIINKPIGFIEQHHNLLMPIFIIGILVISTIVSLIVLLVLNRKDKETLISNAEFLKTKNNANGHFVTNISHELRTPVSVILSANQLIKLKVHKENLAENFDIALNSVNQNCYRILRIINNMIDMAKVESGENNLNLKNHNFVEIVENTISSVIPYAKLKNIDIVFDTEYEQIIMAIDKEKIEKVILNLVSNAIKFSKGKGNIAITITNKNDKLQLIVEDSGTGIRRNCLDSIFEKFVKADNSLKRVSEGSGIGLAIVKSFVEMHKGTVKVKSIEYVGTQFTVELPIVVLHGSEQKKNSNCEPKYTIVNTKIELSDIYF